MGHLLRQIFLTFVVTIVSAGMALSAGKAAMAIECDMTLSRLYVNALPEQSPASPAHSGTDHGHLDAAEVELEHLHGSHSGDDNDRDAHASHCETHACPSSAIAAFGGLMQPTIIGQGILVLPTEPLVELTVGEGLRRPPRA